VQLIDDQIGVVWRDEALVMPRIGTGRPDDAVHAEREGRAGCQFSRIRIALVANAPLTDDVVLVQIPVLYARQKSGPITGRIFDEQKSRVRVRAPTGCTAKPTVQIDGLRQRTPNLECGSAGNQRGPMGVFEVILLCDKAICLSELADAEVSQSYLRD